MMSRWHLACMGATALVVVAFALFVWPTPYRYDTVRNGYGASTVIRTNRITSAIETLTFEGWKRPATWRDRAIPVSEK